jgi:dihydroxyacetone kinase
MKKLINRPENVVREMLEGVVALSPACAIMANENVVVQSGLEEATRRYVAVISGGGSGHEPAHAGYVGPGMLTAAVAGDVFTSPSADAIFAAIRAASGPAGAVVIVKNYTGDRLNFGMAAEMARAAGIPVEIVVVADDVALHDTVPEDRRRGIAGTVLVHKVAGAAAAQGLALSKVALIAREAATDVASMGVSLGACTLPSVGQPNFELADDEIEIGLGIHGEPGVQRTMIASADDLVAMMVDTFIADAKIKYGEEVALLVNGLGSTPPLELAILGGSAIKKLREKGIDVVRVWAGTFLSALDMPGFSLSVMPVDAHRLEMLDWPTSTFAWPGKGVTQKPSAAITLPATTSADEAIFMSAANGQSGLWLRAAFGRIAKALIEAEDQLAKLDATAGDGDLGASMRRGAEALRAVPEAAFSHPAKALGDAADRVRKAIAGSSGPFYATALMRAARDLVHLREPTAKDVALAFSGAVRAIMDLGGAKPGDRTMVDALHPAAEAFAAAVSDNQSLKIALSEALSAAEEGAKQTSAMHPRLGRASYLGTRAIGSPDAGAVAVTIWLDAAASDDGAVASFDQ